MWRGNVQLRYKTPFTAPLIHHRSAPCDTDRQRTATSSLDIDSWFSHGAERIGDEHCNIFPRHLYITVPLRSVRQWRVQHFNIGTSPLAIYTLPFRSAPCDTDRQRTATSSLAIDSWCVDFFQFPGKMHFHTINTI